VIRVAHHQAAFAGRGDALLVEPVRAGVQLYRLDGSGAPKVLATPSVPRLYASARDDVAGWLGGNVEHWVDI